MVERALGAMEALGSTVVDTDTGDSFAYAFAEGTVLISELKVHMAEYLAGLGHTPIRTLADVISFNQAHCREEMKYFGQEVFELSEATSGDLMDPAYLEARALCLQLSRAEGIDAAIERDRLDAIVAPSLSFATSPAAVAGYPSISVPVGLTDSGVARRDLDVRRVSSGAQAARVCLRSRAGVTSSQGPDLSGAASHPSLPMPESAQPRVPA